MHLKLTYLSIIVLFTLFSFHNTHAQEPSVHQAMILPSPAVITPNAMTLSVVVRNNVATSNPFDSNNRMELYIDFARFTPNITSPTGPGAALFHWTYLGCTANCNDADASNDIFKFKGI